MSELTQERARELFNYDPDTGVVTRKITTSHNAIKGSTVGYVTTSGYLSLSVQNKHYYVHRIIWLLVYGNFPSDQTDHKNQIRTDNRLSNLRSVTRKTNSKNKRLPSNNTSGSMGVYWSKHSGKWLSAIQINGKAIHLGSFEHFKDALVVRKSAEQKYSFHENHGQCASRIRDLKL